MNETILDLDNKDARNFFLKSSSYCNFDLPIYFDFAPLLKQLAQTEEIPKTIECDKKGRIKTYTRIFKKIDEDQVNSLLYMNKDGRFAWRPLQLMNPIAYVYLVNVITEQKNWKKIKNRFSKFQQNKNIVCCSVPSVFNSKPSKSKDINNWHEWFEKESIKQSLDFNYMVSTDISNCYGSIYTHSIAWALHRKGRKGAKKDQNSPRIHNAIDRIIQDIQYSQTVGMPQGNVLMDFIAEIVLGYADLELTKKLNNIGIEKGSYRILRYRDDYRIFANTKIDAEKIMKNLSEVLTVLNLKLNEHKTSITEHIVTDSQKSDKLYYRNINWNENLNIRILQIHSFSEQYPNSGSVSKILTKFYEDFEAKAIGLDLELIAGVTVDIAYHNPRTYPYVISILGKISSLLGRLETEELFRKIEKKIEKIPNNAYLNIWLQRLAKNETIERICTGDLCNCVKKYCIESKAYSGTKIWRFKDYPKAIKDILERTPVINKQKFDGMQDYPDSEEIRLFSKY